MQKLSFYLLLKPSASRFSWLIVDHYFPVFAFLDCCFFNCMANAWVRGSFKFWNFEMKILHLCLGVKETYIWCAYLNWCSLKQHNGELKGGAKASRAGRPWICACLICGFRDKSEGMHLIFSFFNLPLISCFGGKKVSICCLPFLAHMNLLKNQNAYIYSCYRVNLVLP